MARVKIVIEMDGLCVGEGLGGSWEHVKNLGDLHALADSAEEIVLLVRGLAGTDTRVLPLKPKVR
jgi:hypothetical protein